MSLGIQAQIINFPDPNFKAKLLSSSPANTVAKDLSGNYFAIDANGDGEIDQNEAQAVTELNISNANISSLTGISNFQLIYLNCSNNQITSLDLSTLYLFGLDCSHNLISSLDLSSSPEIVTLDCSFNSLTDLQLTTNGQLDDINCSHNQIATLSLSTSQVWMMPNPRNIDCSYNSLTSFSLASNVIYGDVNCSHNQITTLSVKNKTMSSLDCSYNLISSLDFQDVKLQNLSVLNVSNNPGLTSICKNEGDTLPSTGAVSQMVCNGAVIGFDQGFKKILLSSNLDACTYGYYNWVAKDINNNCLDLDPDQDGEMLQIDLDKVAYLQFFYDPTSSTNHNFVTTNGIQHLVNLKEIHGVTGGTSSYATGSLGSIVIDGHQNLETIDLTQFYVKSVDIKNTPKLKKVLTGTNHSYAGGDALAYEFSNCPLLEEVYGMQSKLTALTFLNCPNVKNIDVTGNRLASFDASMLPNLENLHIGNYRAYTSSPTETVDYPKNTMTTFDISGHTKLKNFSCTKGVLTSLNIQNCPLLETVNCSDNELTSLQVSGTNMTIPLQYYNFNNGTANLCANNNKLENLDFSNSKINSITINNNLLKTILLKNGFTETITFNNNPSIKFICIDLPELSSIQALVNQYGYTNTCNVNSYCSFTPGGNYNTITGTVRFDENNNGCDAGDEVFEHMKLKINDGTTTGETFVKNNGKYDFYALAGNFTVTVEPENPSLFTVTPSIFVINFADANNNVSTQNICVTQNGNVKDLEVIFAPVTDARPGFDAVYKLIWRNKGNTTLSGTVTLAFDNTKMLFLSSVLPSTVSGNQVTFNFTNLKPYANTSSELTFKINAPTNPTNPVNIGDTLNFSAIIDSPSGESTPEDNEFAFKQTVVGSFDPNDITCLEGSQVPSSMIGKYLHYIVNFENTGTAPATNIVVEMNVNPDDFDISSLQLQNTSHSTYTKVTGNKVEFIMKDINLAALAHGNVALKIKSNNNLITGDSVSNQANIYFDYNFPVETNEAITLIKNPTLQTNDTISNNSINIYPNPTKDDVNISTDAKIKSIEVYDAQGRIIQKHMGINSQHAKISIRSNTSGLYIFKIITEKEVVMKKVMKN